MRSVGNRRCPFRFRVPIPCLNNLDIYKQTAAARLPHCEGGRARAYTLKLNTPTDFPPGPVCSKSPSLARLFILAFLSSPLLSIITTRT